MAHYPDCHKEKIAKQDTAYALLLTSKSSNKTNKTENSYCELRTLGTQSTHVNKANENSYYCELVVSFYAMSQMQKYGLILLDDTNNKAVIYFDNANLESLVSNNYVDEQGFFIYRMYSDECVYKNVITLTNVAPTTDIAYKQHLINNISILNTKCEFVAPKPTVSTIITERYKMGLCIHDIYIKCQSISINDNFEYKCDSTQWNVYTDSLFNPTINMNQMLLCHTNI